MTTRKRLLGRASSPAAFTLVVACLTLLCGGCATPGPLHVYSLAAASLATVRDSGADTTAEVPSFIKPGEMLAGFAYDPFTDHFFLRLAPGNVIRVVDRPARAIKREFRVGELSSTGGGDLAIRPRDGHVFALEPTARDAVECTRLGEYVRRIPLEGLSTGPSGITYDVTRDQFFVLTIDPTPRITAHSLDGRILSAVELDREVKPGSLAYDSERREFYAPLAPDGAIGVFSEEGRLRRMIHGLATFVDVGPRSFLRMF